MFAKINSLGLFGLNAFNVDVEIEISRGIPAFDIVGLPDLVVKESRERIKASMRCCNIEFPVAKVMVNLAPAGTRKSGSVHDIAILVAVLKAAGYIKENLDSCCFIGELSLNGTLRPIEGVLPMVLLARETGFKSVFPRTMLLKLPLPKVSTYMQPNLYHKSLTILQCVQELKNNRNSYLKINRKTIRLIFQMSKVKKQPKQLLKLPQLEDIMHFLSVLPEAEKVCWQSECLLYFRK